jgi:integrase
MINQIKDVQPIRSKKDLDNMKWALSKFCGQRDLCLFILGCETGLRCSDLLKIKTKEITKLRNKNNKIFKIKEKKTSKTRYVNLNHVWDTLIKWADNNNSEWLFPSRKGDKPISVTQAYRQLNKAAYWAEIDHVGTHTMRKTFGYWFYKKTGNIAMLQGILNHSNEQETLRYIGISDEEVNNTLKNFSVFDEE